MKTKSTSTMLRSALPMVAAFSLTAGSLCALMSEGLSQQLQTHDPLPPNSWRSTDASSHSSTHSYPVAPRQQSVAKQSLGQYALKRVSAEQIEPPCERSTPSSLSAELQLEKCQRLQQISKRLQTILQIGPDCGPVASPTGDNLFPSETSPFLPPIPAPLDDSSPAARTMPQQVNSGGMKDSHQTEGGVPKAEEILPILPQIDGPRPDLDESAKPVLTVPDEAAEVESPDDSTGDSTDDSTGETTGETTDSATEIQPQESLDLPPSAEESPLAEKSPGGMPEISRMIDSLIQQPANTNPEKAEDAVEQPISATTVLDTPVDRLRLSDSLFASKEFSMALQMYEALDTKDLVDSERYWVTYQKACCLRRLDAIPEAQSIYRQLAGDSNAGWLAGLSRWWLDRINDRLELQAEVDKVANVLNAVQEAKDAGTFK